MSSRARSHTARRSSAAIAAAALALAVGAAGCGGDAPTAAVEPSTDQATAGSGGEAQERDPDGVVDVSGTEPVGEVLAGSVAPLVTCNDWNGANRKQRLATIADVRSQINLTDSGIEMPSLTDEEAGELFDNACKPGWAAGFRLYKLYARGVGFVELKRDLEE